MSIVQTMALGDHTDPDLFAPLLAIDDHEHGMAVYLDIERRVLGSTEICGAGSSITLPVRRFARDALVHDATYMMLAHNHPSGDPTPSRADIETTRRLARLLRLLDMRLYDHLIVTRDGGMTSFRDLGWL